MSIFGYAQVLNHFTKEWKGSSCNYNVLIFLDKMLITKLNFNAEIKIKYVILELPFRCDLNAFATAVKFDINAGCFSFVIYDT